MYVNKFSLLLKGTVFTNKQSIDTKQKETKSKNSGQAYLNAYKEIIENILDPTSGLSEEKKAAFEEKINRKIKNGEKLTSEELRYIQLKNPQMYAQISRVQMQRESLENRLKNCRSKQEVEEVYCDTVLMVDEDDEAKVALLAAYKNALDEFRKTGEYDSLPQKTDNSADKLPMKVGSTDKDDILEDLYPYYDSQSLSYLNVHA